MSIPGGAFTDCEKLETPHLLRPDGKTAPAFKSRSNALVAMRAATIEHESKLADLAKRVAALEAQPSHPFP